MSALSRHQEAILKRVKAGDLIMLTKADDGEHFAFLSGRGIAPQTVRRLIAAGALFPRADGLLEEHAQTFGANP